MSADEVPDLVQQTINAAGYHRQSKGCDGFAGSVINALPDFAFALMREPIISSRVTFMVV